MGEKKKKTVVVTKNNYIVAKSDLLVDFFYS